MILKSYVTCFEYNVCYAQEIIEKLMINELYYKCPLFSVLQSITIVSIYSKCYIYIYVLNVCYVILLEIMSPS